MGVDFDFLKNNFIQEAKELLESLESQLLILEKEPGNTVIIQEVFRITHTLKGSAGMYGFEKISELTHHLENIYDSIRKKTLEAKKEIISLTLKSADFLRFLLDNNTFTGSKEKEDYLELLNEIRINDNKKPAQRTDIETQPEEDFGIFEETYYYFIHYKPGKDIYKRGMNPYYLFEDLKELGNYYADPEIDVKSALNNVAVSDFNGEWKIYLSSLRRLKEIQELFFFFNENEYKIFQIDPIDLSKDKIFKKYFSQTFNYPVDGDKVNKIFSGLQVINDKYISAPENIPVPEVSKSSQVKENIVKKTESIRVSSDKLDELINLVSELVIINSQLSFLVKDVNNLQLKKTIGTLEKLYKQLRNNALELRLVPLQSITLKFHRLVRDLAGKLNKDVDLVLIGENTELDSNIINLIESPLMHIIRNSMDHGIEDAEERIKKGKQPKGIIRLISFYSGANVFIQVQDDGKGIDTEYIRKKAIDKGIINPTDKLSDKELYDIIFLPGFSTAQGLTEISGRGVGMDVVKKNIQELRGTIEIDSEKGLGTSVTLKLPLTLSIIDTLHIKVDDKAYLIPLNIVDNCQKINHSKLEESKNRQINFNGEILPYIYLREYFYSDKEAPAIENLVILIHNEKKYGLVVDKVIGEHQAVVKPLGYIHKNQEYITGAGILGDGKLALILDTTKLISSIKKEAIFN